MLLFYIKTIRVKSRPFTTVRMLYGFYSLGFLTFFLLVTMQRSLELNLKIEIHLGINK